jgi:2-oxoglutarate dehydrogenase E2 component (dihydrolipoamide succinyltransferase)
LTFFASIQGSGAAGRVMKQDVQNAIGSAPVAPVASAAPIAPVAPLAPVAPATKTVDRGEERQRMTKRRATIARRLVEAQHNAAMLTTFNEVDMSAVMALRSQRREAFQQRHGIGLGFMSFFTKAAVSALKAFPNVNG